MPSVVRIVVSFANKLLYCAARVSFSSFILAGASPTRGFTTFLVPELELGGEVGATFFGGARGGLVGAGPRTFDALAAVGFISLSSELALTAGFGTGGGGVPAFRARASEAFVGA